MKLPMPQAVFRYLLGAAASRVGDHGHVATATTVYFTTGELRLHLPDVPGVAPLTRSVTLRRDYGRCG